MPLIAPVLYLYQYYQYTDSKYMPIIFISTAYGHVIARMRIVNFTIKPAYTHTV